MSAVPTVLRKIRDVITAGIPAATDLEVLFGPRVQGDDTPRTVWIGWGGDPGDLTMARFTQDWAGLGAKRKNEPVQIPCCVAFWSGDDDPGALDVLLDGVDALFGLVETALRTDPGLGRPGPFVVSVSAGELVPDLAAGLLRLPFTVSVTYSRI